MSIAQRLMGKLTFAHLNGPRAAAQAEDEERKDDDQTKASAEGDDDKKDDAPDDKKDAKAEGGGSSDDNDEDDKPGASADGDKSDNEDDEDSDKEMSGNSPAAAARRRERARCAAIFACKAAGRNPEMAAALAFTTNMPRASAIAALEALPTTARGGSERAARNPSLGAGGGQANGNSAAAAQAGWNKAFERYSR